MENLSKLKKERGYCKAAITRAQNAANQYDKMLTSELLARKDNLLQKYKDYEQLCKEVFIYGDDDDEAIEETECKYYEVLGALDCEIEKRKVKELIQPPSNPPSASAKLPSIEIKPYTARAYQLERSLEDEHNISDFLEFLERRALAMESAEPTTREARSSRTNVNAVTIKQPCFFCECLVHAFRPGSNPRPLSSGRRR
ncbi:hypothetical protein K1T71_002849 [Dendrolimus kikuchii]|uniref:Uncharacterized protein n=1 Tax=Dendrolimus kikuchii TaxID=765133 RepID=A0ACC1DEU9_9NEOP|nr:hypothetical protein K1T71_002849 [Dendrolimus kikuchii]